MYSKFGRFAWRESNRRRNSSALLFRCDTQPDLLTQSAQDRCLISVAEILLLEYRFGILTISG
jgi:hypothetical protein